MHPRERRGHFIRHELCARLGKNPDDFPSVRVESILAIVALDEGGSRLYLEGPSKLEVPLAPREVVEALRLVEDTEAYAQIDGVVLSVWVRARHLAAVLDKASILLRDGRKIRLDDREEPWS